MSTVGPRTNLIDSIAGTDIGNMYISKDYLIDVYPYLIPSEGRSSPGLWGWGYNSYGELGLGDTINRSSPVQIGSLTNWKLISGGGMHSLAIKTDGTLWVWGYNGDGQLGLGDQVYRSSPVQVGSLTNWKIVCNSLRGSLAIKTDGTIWSWGWNGGGQLGLGDVVDRSSPVQIGSLTTWKSIISTEYSDSTLALKTDGTLWGWGGNYAGQLGLGDITNRSSPVQIGSLTNWKLVSCGKYYSMSIKTDGTLWSWGSNESGQLGLGDMGHRSSPVQVGTLTDWKSISAGSFSSTCLAIKTDGTLWSWGSNNSGQLGLGDSTNRSSPVQVGSLTNWKQIVVGGVQYPYTLALKTDGTLWSWGYNGSGELGLKDTISRSSPVQVGSLTNWKAITAGNEHSLAIQDSSI